VKLTKELIEAIGFQYMPTWRHWAAYGIYLQPITDSDDWRIEVNKKSFLVSNLYDLVGQIYGVGCENGDTSARREVAETLKDLMQIE
jgi:hypothetical protein